MTNNDIEQRLDEMLWDLVSHAKNPHDRNNKFHSVADAKQAILSLLTEAETRTREHLKEAVLAAIGEDDELFGHGNDWEGSKYQNDLRDEIRKAILTMFEGE